MGGFGRAPRISHRKGTVCACFCDYLISLGVVERLFAERSRFGCVIAILRVWCAMAVGLDVRMD